MRSIAKVFGISLSAIGKRLTRPELALTLALTCSATVASQEALAVPTTVDPGFVVTTFNVGFFSTGLAPGPGGPFGLDLYAISGPGGVDRLDPTTGNVTDFARSPVFNPSGLAFDNGAFGTGELYAVSNDTPGSVGAVSGMTTVVTSGLLTSSNDLAFAPPGGTYGSDLFVTNGSFGRIGDVSRVTAAAVVSVFVSAADLPDVAIGIAFSDSGSAFGEAMFLSVNDGTILQVDVAGNLSLFASGLGDAIDVAVSTGGAFGEHLYVTDPITQTILRVDPSGNVSTFATGFGFTTTGFDADLVFSRDGNTLFVSNNRDIVAISAAIPSTTTTTTSSTTTTTTTSTTTTTTTTSTTTTLPPVAGCEEFRCGKSGRKIEICHVPSWNVDKARTLCIGLPAVPAHLAGHPGDRCGPCE